MLASLSGVLFISKFLKEWTDNNLKYLITFASGVFLIVTFNLISEAFEFSTNKTIVIVSVFAGFIFFLLLERLYPEIHCHHEGDNCLAKKNKKGAQRVLIGDAFHNIGDGILLAPIFVTDISLGFIAAIGIFVHEFVQEISEFFVLKSAGYSTKKALTRNFLISATILIGAVGGFYLSSFENLVAPLVGLAAGAFIYILLIDLIPQSVKNSAKEKKYFNYIAWTLLGVLLILVVNTLISGDQLEKKGLDSHGHASHEEHVHHNEEDHHDH
jgi:zinc and cadmium transporter